MLKSQTYFDPDAYVESLLDDTGFEEASPEDRKQMRKALNEQIANLTLNAISMYVEPEEIDEALIRFGDIKEIAKFIEKLVEISPTAQMAIIEALDNFYAETVDTYEEFKNM